MRYELCGAVALYSMVKIGFDATAKGGPGIFLTRLQNCLQEMDAFSTENPHAWLQLSHKPLPPAGQKYGKLMVRTAGGYYYRNYLISKPLIVPLPWVDDFVSQRRNEKLNRPIRNMLAKADGVVFQSEFTRTMVRHFILPCASGNVIMNGVDLRTFRPPEHSERSGKKGLDILVSHQFRPHKRLHDVIRVVSKLRDLQRPSHQPITLHVLGGDSRNAFEMAKAVITQERMEDCVKFWGHQPAETLPNFYRRCDFMMALPLWDPCPNTVVEAISCGLPVITTKASGGIPEIMDQAGRIVSETVPLNFMDHHHAQYIPEVPAEETLRETCALLAQLEDYRALAREQAIQCLDIRHIAKQYLDYALRLIEDPSESL